MCWEPWPGNRNVMGLPGTPRSPLTETLGSPDSRACAAPCALAISPRGHGRTVHGPSPAYGKRRRYFPRDVRRDVGPVVSRRHRAPWRSWPKLSPHACFLLLGRRPALAAPHNNLGVSPTYPERADTRAPRPIERPLRQFGRNIERRIGEVDFRVWFLEVETWRNFAGLDAKRRFYCASKS